MNWIKRAFRSISYHKKNTILMFLSFLILSILILFGLLFRLEYGYRGVLPVAVLHTFFHLVCGNQIREKGLRRTAEGKGEEKAVPRPKRLAFCNRHFFDCSDNSDGAPKKGS